MTTVTVSVSGQVWFRSKQGWTVYCRDHWHMRNQSVAMHEVKRVIPSMAPWEELQEIFRNFDKYLTENKIKNTVSVYLEKNRIEVCRKYKTLPSVWIINEENHEQHESSVSGELGRGETNSQEERLPAGELGESSEGATNTGEES